MKLLAIYLGNYGIFQDQLLSFSSDYKITYNVEYEDSISLCIEHERLLPNHFFSLRPSEEECVSSVSAIVGKNGSGKTSIARLLCNLPTRGDHFRNTKIVVIVEVDKKLLAYTSYGKDKVHIKVTNGEEVEINTLLNNDDGGSSRIPFKFFYFSPHYTTEQYDWDMANERDAVFNISTTWLMHHPEGNSETLVHDGVSNLRIFDVDEKIRVLEFCEVYRRELQSEVSVTENVDGHENIARSNDQIRFDFPVPQAVSIAPYTEGVTQAIKELRNFLEKKQKEEFGVPQSVMIIPKSSEYALHDPVGNFIKPFVVYLENALSCSDFFTRVFAAYVARYLQECGIMGAGFPEVEIMPDSYLSALKSFIVSHEQHKAIEPKDVITFFKSSVPPLNGEFDKDNSRGEKKPYPYAKEFFTCLSKVCELQGKKNADDMPSVQCFANGEMHCLLSNKKALKLIDELIRLHSLTKIFSPFLTFDILPKMSSGEMAFLSMFARLYRFVGEKTKPWDDVMIFLDEAETTLHPEWQRRLVGYFIRFFEVFIPHRHYQLVFASHSPVLLSDIPVGNCCCLNVVNGEDNGFRKKYAESCGFRSSEESRNTFGANIYDLFHNAFFMDNGSIGEFSAMVIRRQLKRIATQALRCDKKITEGITKASDNEDELTQALIGDRVLIRYFNVLKEQGLI